MADNGHNDHSRSRFEDEFSAALRRDIDNAGGPIGADVHAELAGAVRRRRTARTVTASALSAALVLGLGGIGWTVASNLGSHRTPDVAGPTMTSPPAGIDWSDGCSLTADNALNSPIYADGWTLDNFTIEENGDPSAEFNGPDSVNAQLNHDFILYRYNPDELFAGISRNRLHTVWLPAELDGSLGSIAGTPIVGGAVAQPPLPARSELSSTPSYGRWTVWGSTDTGLDCSTGELLTRHSETDPLFSPGLYVVLGYLDTVIGSASRADQISTVYSSNIAIVEAKADGTFVTEQKIPRGDATHLTQRSDSDETTDDALTEGIAATDGRELSFDYRDSQLAEPAEVSKPDDFTTSEGPLADITLLGPTAKDGVWFANRPESADWRDLRFGTWSSADGFKPWSKTRDIAPSKETRFVPSVAVAGDDPNRIVWIESEGFGTGMSGFWVFTANARTGQIDVLATPDDTADNTIETPTVTARDGHAYWSTTTSSGVFVVDSRAIDRSGPITTIAEDVSLPVAGRNGLWALQVGRQSQLQATGVVKLEPDGIKPFLTFPADPGPLPQLQVSDQSVAVIANSTLYVVPQGEDTVVWTLSLDDGAFPRLTSNGYLFWSVSDDDDLHTIYAADTGSGSDRIMRANLCERSCGPSNSLRKLPLGGAWAEGGGAVAWLTPADDAVQATGLILHWPLMTMTHEVG